MSSFCLMNYMGIDTGGHDKHDRGSYDSDQYGSGYDWSEGDMGAILSLGIGGGILLFLIFLLYFGSPGKQRAMHIGDYECIDRGAYLDCTLLK